MGSDSKIVVAADVQFTSHEQEQKVLDQVGAKIIQPPGFPDFKEADLIETCRHAVGVMVNRARISRPVIEAMQNCKVLSVYGIGYDSIDVAAATEKRIPIVNLPGFCAEEVSEHAIMLLLAVAHKLIVQANNTKAMKEPLWSYKPYPPIYRLAGKTLGVVGLGHIGRATARKAKGLGMRVIAWSRSATPEMGKELGIDILPFEQVLREADHVSLHIALKPETTKIIGREQLRMMKRSAILVNTGRGGLIDQEALLHALQEGWIAGAGLDVVVPEPPPPEVYRTLFALDNVVITPHTSWYSEESLAYLKTHVALNIVKVLRNEPPINIVNPEIYR